MAPKIRDVVPSAKQLEAVLAGVPTPLEIVDAQGKYWGQRTNGAVWGEPHFLDVEGDNRFLYRFVFRVRGHEDFAHELFTFRFTPDGYPVALYFNGTTSWAEDEKGLLNGLQLIFHNVNTLALAYQLRRIVLPAPQTPTGP